jgi:hypothetical protein
MLIDLKYCYDIILCCVHSRETRLGCYRLREPAVLVSCLRARAGGPQGRDALKGTRGGRRRPRPSPASSTVADHYTNWSRPAVGLALAVLVVRMVLF